jgi:hypothetical protein
MLHAGVYTPRGYEAIVAVRMPAPFRNWAVAVLAARNGQAVVSEEEIVALFQEFIDGHCLRPQPEDPLSCDPGGGMRSPDDWDDAHEEQTVLV